MKKSLKSLLNALGKVEEDFPEVTDTDIREGMRDTIVQSLLNPVPNYVLRTAICCPIRRAMPGSSGSIESVRVEYAALESYK